MKVYTQEEVDLIAKQIKQQLLDELYNRNKNCEIFFRCWL
jgi:hypothetical protein